MPRARAISAHRIFEEGRWRNAALYDRALLRPGDRIAGPAVIVELSATTYLAHRLDRLGRRAFSNLVLTANFRRSTPMTARRPLDPAEIAVLGHALHSVAVEMGAALRRTAFSPNIKERRDYSSAVFSADGDLIAMGDDMPVHLGSMPMSVAAVLADLRLNPGDIALLNDPYRGGTHLPDITMVAPVFLPGRTRASFYVANRAHHADVGGMYPGSMGPCREIAQEGIRIPPVKLMHARQNGHASSRHHPRQRAHAARTRRRPHRAARRMPHRRRAHARTRRALRLHATCSRRRGHARLAPSG